MAKTPENKEELFIIPEQMGQFSGEYPGGKILLTKSQLDGFFAEQRKRETNGETVARLMGEGRWKECLAQWIRDG